MSVAVLVATPRSVVVEGWGRRLVLWLCLVLWRLVLRFQPEEGEGIEDNKAPWDDDVVAVVVGIGSEKDATEAIIAIPTSHRTLLWQLLFRNDPCMVLVVIVVVSVTEFYAVARINTALVVGVKF